MNVNIEEQTFLFLAGLHRSGTSLLHRVIRDHPDVSGLSDTGVSEDEGQHVQNIYPNAKVFGGPGRFAFYSDAHMDENHELISRENAEKIIQAWEPYLELPNRYIVEKSPPNMIRTRFLQELFPNSRFIFIFRHPVAVSYATKKWANLPVMNLLDHTLKAYEIAMSDLSHLQSAYFVRYEDFVADPSVESKKIFDFLGVKPIEVVQTIKKDINIKYFQCWRKDRKKRNILLKKTINEEDLLPLEKRAFDFGYSIINPEKTLPLPEVLGSLRRGCE